MFDIGPPRNCLMPLNQTARPYQGLCSLGNDMFASVENFDVMKQSDSTGNFVATGQTPRSYWGIAAFAGDLYVGVRNVDVGKMTGGTGTMALLSWPAKDWRAFATSTDGSLLYLAAYNFDIYTWNGTTLTALGAGALTWHAMAPLGADMYAITNSGATYKRTNNSGAFSLVTTQALTFNAAANCRGTLYGAVANGPPVVWNGSSWATMVPQRSFTLPRAMGSNSRGDLYVADRNVDVYRMWGR